MKSSETHLPDVTRNIEQIRGREAVSSEKAMKTQIDLFWHFMPRKIKDLISSPSSKDNFQEALENNNVTLAEAADKNIEANYLIDCLLKSPYLKSYVIAIFTGFAAYCDMKASDQAFIDRVNQGKLTEADFQNMKEFIIENTTEDHFSGLDSSLDAFIAEYN